MNSAVSNPAPAAGSPPRTAAGNISAHPSSTKKQAEERERQLSWNGQTAASTLQSLANSRQKTSGPAAESTIPAAGEPSSSFTSSTSSSSIAPVAKIPAPMTAKASQSFQVPRPPPSSPPRQSPNNPSRPAASKTALQTIGASKPATPPSTLAQSLPARGGAPAQPQVASTSLSSTLPPQSGPTRRESEGGRSSTDTGTGDEEAEGDVKHGKKKQARRKKANRACMHCQKAHLTCDDARPCERCIKKGLAESCTDGARKKAKYLLDEDEIMELKREKEIKKRESMASTGGESGLDSEDAGRMKTEESEPSPSWPSNPAAAPPHPSASLSLSDLHRRQNSAQTQLGGFTSSASSTVAPSALTDGAIVGGEPQEKGVYTNAPLRNFSPASSGGYNPLFGSEATSLEYNMLSSMLNGIDPSWLTGSSPDQQQGQELGSAIAANGSGLNGGLPHMGLDGMPWRFATDSNVLWQDQADIKFQQLSNNTPRLPLEQLKTPIPSSHVEPLHHMDSSRLPQGVEDGVAAYDALEVPSPHGSSAPKASPTSSGQSGPSPALTSKPNPRAAAAAAAAAAAGQDKKPDAVWMERVKHVYSDRMRPFPYTEGYHFLIKYVTANLEKAEVLRIVRALAIFRPSLIALQMPLTEEDEIFVERSIQRTILEFEKLVSFSGTPTVVWRRTCEICVVGAEFSMLTQWSREHLLGRYIYEFLDKGSILDYWEKFATHAFENTAQSMTMQCSLKTSTGSMVKCAACFSIKRDVFDLPVSYVELCASLLCAPWADEKCPPKVSDRGQLLAHSKLSSRQSR